MKKTIPLSLSLFLLLSCQGKPQKTAVDQQNTPPQTILQKIAHAHGYNHWNAVDEIDFTFNVNRGNSHTQRSWHWNPKQNQITAISGTDTLTYNQKTMDSLAYKTHAGFVNDSYWLLAPFHLIWDAANLTYQHTESQNAPISGQPMQKLTIVYANQGGYTPGDAYDLYFTDDFIIREWVYRKANQQQPSLTTTWENYTERQGLLLAQNHQNPQQQFRLYFTNLTVDKE